MKLARLDDAGELLAIDEVPPDQWVESANAVPLPDDTDLEPGRARWDRARKTFHIRPPTGAGRPMQQLDSETIAAIALGFLALRKSGQHFPARTQAWLAEWMRSVDAAGLIDRKGDPL